MTNNELTIVKNNLADFIFDSEASKNNPIVYKTCEGVEKKISFNAFRSFVGQVTNAEKLKRFISDGELVRMLLLVMGKGLDLETNDVYFLLYDKKDAKKNVVGATLTPILSIDYFIKTLSESGCYGLKVEIPEFYPLSVNRQFTGISSNIRIPVKAVASCYRKGVDKKDYAEAYFDEYFASTKDSSLNRKYPKKMLTKVAIVSLARMIRPDVLGGLRIAEEMPSQRSISPDASDVSIEVPNPFTTEDSPKKEQKPEQKRDNIVKEFLKLGVPTSTLVKKFGDLDDLSAQKIADLRATYRIIKDGISTVDDVFHNEENQVEVSSFVENDDDFANQFYEPTIEQVKDVFAGDEEESTTVCRKCLSTKVVEKQKKNGDAFWKCQDCQAYSYDGINFKEDKKNA